MIRSLGHPTSRSFKRRSFLAGLGGVTSAAVVGSPSAEAALRRGPGRSSGWPVDFTHQPVPPQAPAVRGTVRVDGAELAYWDTGGRGPAIVFMHARSGSLNSWPYQQPVLARAGFRVIGYSRRGHEGSTHTSVGFGADDLVALLDRLRIDRAHVVAHAAGGLWGLDFALANPRRLRTLTLACTTFGIAEPDFAQAVADLRPDGFEEMPPDFRELGPSYRSADPEGVNEWLAIEERALNGAFFYQGYRSPMTWAAIEALRAPVLLLSTDSDMYMTPPLMHEAARHLQNPTEVTIAGSGHCPHWERPREFNDALVWFMRRSGDRRH